MRGRNWFRDVNHCASSRRQRRHLGNVAGGARYQHLAGDSRRRDHHRLFCNVSRRYACHHLRRARRLHTLVEKANCGFTRAHDLRSRLFRDPVQFRGHSPRRHLGRSILGTFLGLGPERKRRGADRPLVRNHFARSLGRVHPATRSDDHGALRQYRDQFLVVRRKHAWRGVAFLRLHAKSISMAGGFMISQLALMAVASMPLEKWRSFAPAQVPSRGGRPQIVSSLPAGQAPTQ